LDPDDFKCKWIDKKDLWEIADRVRDTHWPQKTLPVNTEHIVEFRLRLGIEPQHNLFSTVDMDAYLKMDLTGIVVDYNFYMNEKFFNRMRFSFAHELGHFFLHQDILATFNVNSPEVWKNFILTVSETEYRNFEWQANEFAGRLLVPYPDLSREIEKVVEVVKKSKLAHYLQNDPDAVLSRVSPMLCKLFGVSTDVIEKRAEREGLWPPEFC